MAEMDEKLRKMADDALTKSGADVTISGDGVPDKLLWDIKQVI